MNRGVFLSGTGSGNRPHEATARGKPSFGAEAPGVTPIRGLPAVPLLPSTFTGHSGIPTRLRNSRHGRVCPQFLCGRQDRGGLSGLAGLFAAGTVPCLFGVPSRAQDQAAVSRLPGGHLPTGRPKFHSACADLKPARKLVIYPGGETYRIAEDIEAMPPSAAAMAITGAR